MLTLILCQRTQTKFTHRLEIYKKDKDTIHITFSSVLKHSRPGRQLTAVILKCYLADTKICPVEVLHTHWKATKEIRKKETKLLISFFKPHSAVTPKTISRRIKLFFREIGIDTTTFQGHNLHSSSSSKPKLNGTNITQILNAGGWSNKQKFAKFYHGGCINDKTNKILL